MADYVVVNHNVLALGATVLACLYVAWAGLALRPQNLPRPLQWVIVGVWGRAHGEIVLPVGRPPRLLPCVRPPTWRLPSLRARRVIFFLFFFNVHSYKIRKCVYIRDF